MAAPSDRVQVIKQESAAGGGDPADADPFYAHTPIDETEDGLSAAGFFVQVQGGPADEAAAIWREGGTLKAKDPANGTVDLLSIATDDRRSLVSIDDTTAGFLEEKIVTTRGIDVTVQNPASAEQLEISLGFRRQFLFMGA